jgi:hypothetical protein
VWAQGSGGNPDITFGPITLTGPSPYTFRVDPNGTATGTVTVQITSP